MESFAPLSSTEQKSKEQVSRMDDARVFWNNENQRCLHNLDANHYRQYSLQSIEGIFHFQTFIFPFSMSWVHVNSAHSFQLACCVIWMLQFKNESTYTQQFENRPQCLKKSPLNDLPIWAEL